MRARATAPVLAAAVLLAACGGGSSPQDEVAEASRKLGDVRSADLALRMEAAPAGDDAAPVGFSLEGEFALAQPGRLPLAELTYTRVAGTAEAEARFVSTGESAYVVTDEGAHELGDDEVAGLRAPAGEAGDDGGDESPLGTLALDRWISDARSAGEGTAGGVAVERFEGGVDVPRALTDLSSLATGLGADPGVRPLPEEDRDRLAAVVERARMTVHVGRDDGIPRLVEVEVAFSATSSAEDSAALAEALGPLAGVRLLLRLELSDVNRPVEVDAP